MPIDELIRKLEWLQRLSPDLEVEILAFSPTSARLEGDPVFYINTRLHLGQYLLLASEHDQVGRDTVEHWEDWMGQHHLLHYQEINPP